MKLGRPKNTRMVFSFFRKSSGIAVGLYLGVLTLGQPLDASAMDPEGIANEIQGRADGLAHAQPADLGRRELPAEEAVAVYRSEVSHYSIVSEGNCTQQADGSLTQCQYPEINLQELSRRLPPLPFETVIKVKVSRSCLLSPRVSTLRIRLGTYGDGLGNALSEEALAAGLDFLRYEDLNIEHNRKVILSQPHQTPLGSLKIAPQAPRIFEESVFPKGCSIKVQVDFNRISLRTEEESKQHVTRIKSQLNLIRASHEAFTLLDSCRNQRQEVAGTVAGLMGLLNRNQARAENCEIQWNSISQILPELTESVEQNGTLFPEMNELIESISEFDQRLRQTLASQNAVPQQFAAVLQASQQADLENTGHRITELLGADYLVISARRVADAEHQIALVEQSLAAYFSDEQAYPRLLEDLSDQLAIGLSGPQGTLDQLTHDLHQIGKRIN